MRKENFCYDQEKIKGKMYQLGRIKGKIILIQERNKINSIKTYGITIGGIKVITTKVLNDIILE